MKSSEISDYVIMFLRFVTSAELHNRQDFFAPFMDEDGMDMEAAPTPRSVPASWTRRQHHLPLLPLRAMEAAPLPPCLLDTMERQGTRTHLCRAPPLTLRKPRPARRAQKYRQSRVDPMGEEADQVREPTALRPHWPRPVACASGHPRSTCARALRRGAGA